MHCESTRSWSCTRGRSRLLTKSHMVQLPSGVVNSPNRISKSQELRQSTLVAWLFQPVTTSKIPSSRHPSPPLRPRATLRTRRPSVERYLYDDETSKIRLAYGLTCSGNVKIRGGALEVRSAFNHTLVHSTLLPAGTIPRRFEGLCSQTTACLKVVLVVDVVREDKSCALAPCNPELSEKLARSFEGELPLLLLFFEILKFPFPQTLPNHISPTTSNSTFLSWTHPSGLDLQLSWRPPPTSTPCSRRGSSRRTNQCTTQSRNRSITAPRVVSSTTRTTKPMTSLNLARNQAITVPSLSTKSLFDTPRTQPTPR